MINDAIAVDSDEFRGYYELARTALIDLAADLHPRRVLEIGCGGGANLVEIKRRHPQCQTTGVEVREEAARIAGRAGVDHVVLGDMLDASTLPFHRGDFDLIILSHVLEHFAHPEQVLALALSWLSEGGRLLIALPNVRHLSVLKELLWDGDFRYQSSGILDHTHLRFFTRKSATRFLQDNGLAIELCRPDISGRKSELLSAMTFGAANDLAAFAYNFLVKKST